MPSSEQNHRVREAMDTLLKMFNEENLEKIARAVFKARIRMSLLINGAFSIGS
jgi:NH3-dependent NAD+ synthetase